MTCKNPAHLHLSVTQISDCSEHLFTILEVVYLVQSLGQKDALEKERAAHPSILAWEIPWAEEPGGINPWGRKSQTQLGN